MDLRERLESTEGLTNIGTWLNERDGYWVCACSIHNGVSYVGQGDSIGAAMLAALADVEENRGKTLLERFPELRRSSPLMRDLAERGHLPANFKHYDEEPEPDPFDGY